MYGMDVDEQGVRDQQHYSTAKSKVAEATAVLNERMVRDAELLANEMIADVRKACNVEMDTFKRKANESCQQRIWKDDMLKTYNEDLFALEDAVFIDNFSKDFTKTVADAKIAAQGLQC